jgi:hypothetical protein
LEKEVIGDWKKGVIGDWLKRGGLGKNEVDC